jgi:uncharacterized protein YgbK (DUF1537 family)
MLKLGCIADDFASALDLVNNLVTAGMRVVLARSVPQAPLERTFADADAVVVALNTRYATSAQAVVQSLNALIWLKAAGAEQIYAAFSPTFDSRYVGEHPGNIGPVMDSLMTALETNFSVICPAYPDAQCTVYKGHLFVGETLLSQSDKGKHALAPMTESNLVLVLQGQTQRTIGRIDHAQVAESRIAIQERLAELRLMEVELAIADATSSEDLLCLGTAVKGMRLVAGSPGLAIGLPINFDVFPSESAGDLPPAAGYTAVVCGSCSDLAAQQVQHFHAQGHPAMAIDPLKVAKFGATRVAQAAATWAAPLLKRGPVMLYSTADAQSVVAVQSLLGTENADKLVAHCMAEIALALVQTGVRRLVVAGTHTAQACLKGLGVSQLRVGNQVDPGAPWCHAGYVPASEQALASSDTARQSGNAEAVEGLHLCLKPGNVGAEDFFTRAFSML